ncbi:putative IS1 encoded protein [Shigella flexneri K-315]|uniref:Putative IS1 encoded protein n=1 Tax=Shigella flexneri K-315 TaxID=766150 RepID=I6CGW0_SHIFL|nr:putative IS1 encoded protein [Shigella flexneri K-315]
MPCFTAMRAEIALMSGSAFAVTHHAFSSGAGRTSDGNGSHASTLKSPSYTKSVSWQHYPGIAQYSPCEINHGLCDITFRNQLPELGAVYRFQDALLLKPSRRCACGNG